MSLAPPTPTPHAPARSARTSTWPAPARYALLLFGLLLIGLAMRLMLDANVGLSPWDAFHQGLARHTGVTVGQATILTGVAILIASRAALGVRPGPGGILNMLLVGVFVDLLHGVSPVPDGIWRWPQFVVGVALMGLGTGTYIASHLGAGPRDGLVLGLTRRLQRPVTPVRTTLELLVLLVGVALGGTVGLGTLLFALGIGPAMTAGLALYGLHRARA